MKTRNAFLEAMLVFGLITLGLAVWITTTHTGLLPMIKKSIPALGGRKFIMQMAVLLGLILPTLWLIVDWSKQPIRLALLAFLFMQGLQIATEFALAHYFSPTLIVPASLVYVGYRIIQIIRLQTLVLQTAYKNILAKFFRSILLIANLILWGTMLIRTLG